MAVSAAASTNEHYSIISGQRLGPEPIVLAGAGDMMPPLRKIAILDSLNDF